MSEPIINLGEHTEIDETSDGETILRNTGGNPINIQTFPSGRAFLQDNDTVTNIAEQGEWYDIEGTWDSAHLNAISATNGSLTYEGNITSQIMYFVGGAAETFSNNQTFEMAVFKNGVIKANTQGQFDFARSDELMSLPAIIGFTDEADPQDTHTVKVRNMTGTEDIRVQSLSFAIKG